MHDRRIRGRKNWNSYLPRYGRCVSCHEWWHQQPDGDARLSERLQQVDPAAFRQDRQETRESHQEQLNRFRFCHRPLAYLASLLQYPQRMIPDGKEEKPETQITPHVSHCSRWVKKSGVAHVEALTFFNNRHFFSETTDQTVSSEGGSRVLPSSKPGKAEGAMSSQRQSSTPVLGSMA